MARGEAGLPKACSRKSRSAQRNPVHFAIGLDSGVVTAVVAITLTGFSLAMMTLAAASNQLVIQQRLQSATDLAALVASDTNRGLISGFVCENAELILQRVDFAMAGCRIVGGVAAVSASVQGYFGPLSAKATAGAPKVRN